MLCDWLPQREIRFEWWFFTVKRIKEEIRNVTVRREACFLLPRRTRNAVRRVNGKAIILK